MTLPAGTRLGPYEILSPLGAGGMGEVYRARDTRLAREVAIKVLPEALSSDHERLRRFEKEAKSASALNHPNIVTIHDIGTQDGVSYIAMELVEGATLRELLASGPLPIKKLLQIAPQISEGLARAHEAGIVHRDLKPENVMVKKDGLVKILDFGLAKLMQPEDSSGATQSPTLSGATEPGLVMGTVGYMSPEQAVGGAVDFRSDQFAFGSVLYEMATGRRAFARATTPETLSAIIREEPEPIAAVAPPTPAPLRWTVERCLSKEPKQRYASTEDLARELASVRDHLSELPVSAEVAAAGVRRSHAGFWLALAGALAVVAVAGAPVVRQMAFSSPPSFTPITYRRGSIRSARFAPDGETVVYSAAWDGRPPQLFLKRPDSPDELPISLPSSDILSISRSGEMAIAVDCRGTHQGVCAGALARATITAGAARSIADNVQQADWAPDGENLVVVRDVGGRGRLEFPIGKLIYETDGHTSFPRLSPKGDQIAFVDHPFKVDNRGSVAIADLAGHKRILTREWAAVEGLAWSPRGDEIWFTATAAGATFALHAVNLSGRERLLARYPEGMRIHDVSRAGRVLLTQDVERVTLAGRTGDEPRERDLSWLDWSIARDISRDGKLLLLGEEGASVGPGYAVCLRGMDGSAVVRLGEGSAYALSPDGRWAAAQLVRGDSPLALLPTGAGERRILPTGGIHAEEVEWLDDKRLIFAGEAAGHPMRLYVQDVGGGEPRAVSPAGIEANYVDRIAPSPDGAVVAAVGPQHRCLLYPVSGGAPARFQDSPTANFRNDGAGTAGGSTSVKRKPRNRRRAFFVSSWRPAAGSPGRS